MDAGTRTNGRAHYPPQALATTHLRHRDIRGTQYVLLKLNLDQCLASMNSGPCTVIELATWYLGMNNQTRQPQKNEAFRIR